jgi:hypothetical protein
MNKKCKVIKDFRYMDGHNEKTIKKGTILSLDTPSEGARMALTLLELAPIKIDGSSMLIGCEHIIPIESDAEDIAVGMSRVTTTSLTAYDVYDNKIEVPAGTIVDIVDPFKLDGKVGRDLSAGLLESRQQRPWCHIRAGYAPEYKGYLLMDVLDWTEPLEKERNK